MKLSNERIRMALRHRLNLFSTRKQYDEANRDDKKLRKEWEEIERWINEDKTRAEGLAKALMSPIVDIIEYGITKKIPADSTNPTNTIKRWEALNAFLYHHYNLQYMMFDAAVKFIEESGKVQDVRSPNLPQHQPSPISPAQQSAKPSKPQPVVNVEVRSKPQTAIPSKHEPSVINQPGTDESRSDDTRPNAMPVDQNARAQEDQPQDGQQSGDEISAPAEWKAIPVPQDQPDPYDEFSSKGPQSSGDLKIIGARVRGKKHKHEGTNCDDWFEFKSVNNWTIIAVSDGAGSKKFSRVGAKASCEAAVSHLADALSEHNLKKRPVWDEETRKATFRRKQPPPDYSEYEEEDVAFVERHIHKAMVEASNAVERAFVSRARNPEYEAFLGRPLQLADLSGTLLLAVHTIIETGTGNYSLIFTCHVGDGMIAVVRPPDRTKPLEQVHILCNPDSGAYSGETAFLIEKGKTERSFLASKTYVFVGRMQALMVMTDGVADDYFPVDPGILELYGDLLVNRLIDIPKPNSNNDGGSYNNDNSESPKNYASGKRLKYFKLSYYKELFTGPSDFNNTQTEEVKTDNNNLPEPSPGAMQIRSIRELAAEKEEDWRSLITTPEILLKSFEKEPNEAETNQGQRLIDWLDNYYRRGSFDDRTLVVLYQEYMP